MLPGSVVLVCLKKGWESQCPGKPSGIVVQPAKKTAGIPVFESVLRITRQQAGTNFS